MKKQLLLPLLLLAFSSLVYAQIPTRLDREVSSKDERTSPPTPATRTEPVKTTPRTTTRPAPTPAPSPAPTTEATKPVPAKETTPPETRPAPAEPQPSASAAVAARRQLIAEGYQVCMKHPEFGNIYCKKSSTQVKSKAGSTTYVYVYVDEDGVVIPIDKKLVENASAEEQTTTTKPQAPKMVRVNRWVSPVVGDFVTVPEDHGTDAQLSAWGYKDKIFQYEAYLTRPDGGNVTTVNRWEMGNCKEFILIAKHEISDAKMTEWGYKNKQFVFYAYQTRPASGNYVAVSRWLNTLADGNGCKDFTLSVAENELTDAQLTSWGYTSKIVQFYVPAP